MKNASQSTKRALSLIMAIAMILTMMPLSVFAADGDNTLYLKPNSNWLDASARFAINYWSDAGGGWADMTDTDGDGYYEGTVPAGYSNIIFVRMNPSTTENNWDNKWNQTNDLTVPTDGTNCYTVADGAWSNGDGSWSTYTPATEDGGDTATLPETLYVDNAAGWSSVNAYFFANGVGVSTSWPGAAMTKDTDGSYSITVPEGAAQVIFNNGSAQTADLAIPTDGNDCFNNSTNTWGVYTPATDDGGDEGDDPVVPAATYVVAGENAAVFGTKWDPSNTANTMTLNADGLYEISYKSVPVCTLAFKVTDGTWDSSWGKDGGTDNFEYKVEAISDVTITFDASSKVITVTATPTGETVDPVTDVIIHYRNSTMWSKVCGFSWDLAGDTEYLKTWPGTELTVNPAAPNWYTVTLSNINAAAGVGVIFNNGNGGSGNQTADIMITADGEYWYDGQLLTEAPDTWADGSVETVTYEVTLHFADAKNWGHANLYTWTATGATPTGAWPGTAADLDSDGFYSRNFTYEAPEGQGLNFIFSGAGQTVDLALAADAFSGDAENGYTAEKWVVPTSQDSEGEYYADIVDSADPIAISPVVNGTSVTFEYKGETTDTVMLYGSMNSWASGYAMTCNDYGVFSVTVNDIAYGIGEYKFVVNGNWITDPLNNWTVNDNSAFLISNPDLDTNTVKINVHYAAPTTEWNVCAWGAPDLEAQYDFTDGVTTITLDGRASQYVAFKVRKSIEGNDWAEQSGEIRVDLGKIVSGTIDVYVGSDFSISQSLNADVVYANKVTSVELDYDDNTVTIKTAQSVNHPENAFAIYKDGADADIIDTVTASGSTYTLTLTETLDLVTLYQYTVRFSEQVKFADHDYVIGTNTVYASDKFGSEFTYNGELGALWTADSTTFAVWAPTAAAVSVNLYTSGTEGTEDLIKSVEMNKGANGVWTATVEGDLNGTYYTYAVTVDGETVEAVDPYARTTGVNGKRGMVIDLDSTDPEGWDADTNPNPITSYTDAIIYELHVRDFSIDDSSGITDANQGKYTAFTEWDTTVDANEDGVNDGEIPSGISYLESLGVTHLHLLPVYDYGSVDETKCDTFNWGYDPVNYNTPEGSYSTDPYNGEVRVNEFKQMVMALHEAGISVIMDVVYNHVYDAGKFCMNQIVPKYFSRVNADGSYSNGSGCGNDTASEREMVRKYIVESVMYWKEEYHIDGFRFDLVGLLDETTINEIVDTVHAKYPDVIFYGEGWTLGTAVEPGNDMATQANAAGTPDFAYFSDTIRNDLAGSNGTSLGFVSGAGNAEAIIASIKASPWWTSNPTQIVQYASCHDNYTLIDKLVISTGKSAIDDDIIKMNNLAAAIYMTSQGIPFIHAGEEFLREKLEEDGGRCENSYNASDYVNHIEWSNLENETYSANVEYYKGLIEFRKEHPALRLATRSAIDAAVTAEKLSDSLIMVTIDGSAVSGEPSDKIVVIYNAGTTDTSVGLPAGDWSLCINGSQAGTDAIMTISNGFVTVNPISATVLVQGQTSMIEIEKAQIDMGTSLEMRFAIPMDELYETEGAYAVIVKEYADGSDDVSVTIPFSAWKTVDIDGDKEADHYKIAFDGVAGKEMADNFYVTIYNAEDNAISDTHVDSIRSYAMRNLTDEESEFNTLLVDMLNYGAAAQKAFGYNLDDLANSLLTDAQQEHATDTVSTCENSTVTNAKNYYGTRLILESKILMQMAFNGVTSGMTAKYTFTNHLGEKATYDAAITISGSVGIVEIDKLVVADGCCDVEVTVYNADGTVYGSVTDSMQRYTTRMSEKAEVYEAIMKFSDSAYAYLHRNDTTT